MLTARAWAERIDIAQKAWLILGKGPTFAKFKALDREPFFVLALNHVVRDVPCDAALMMDYDVFSDCAEAIDANARVLVMPWRPHFEFRPTEKTLQDLLAEHPILAKLAREDRLIFFNAQTARDFAPHPDAPMTPIKFFSAEAALNLLADNGAGVIRTLGVDGGARYAHDFKDLDEKTLLANGRDAFDKQFEQFALTLRRHPKLVFGPLTVQTPIRFFIGCDPTQYLGAKLFEYSVRRYASMSARFEIIDNEGLPTPKDPQRQARTGFSFSRFKIPGLCGRRGRAIYVDADMQVFADARDLWTRDFEDAWVLYSESRGASGRIPQFSVMLMNCAQLDWNAEALVEALDRGEYDYKSLMQDFAMMPSEKKAPALEFEWNSLETYAPGRTKLLHYTDMPTQPWVSDKNPNGEIWYAELRRAIDDGFISRADLDAEIERGHINPLLPNWAGLAPHPKGEELAAHWTPPYRRFVKKAA